MKENCWTVSASKTLSIYHLRSIVARLLKLEIAIIIRRMMTSVCLFQFHRVKKGRKGWKWKINENSWRLFRSVQEWKSMFCFLNWLKIQIQVFSYRSKHAKVDKALNVVTKTKVRKFQPWTEIEREKPSNTWEDSWWKQQQLCFVILKLRMNSFCIIFRSKLFLSNFLLHHSSCCCNCCWFWVFNVCIDWLISGEFKKS